MHAYINTIAPSCDSTQLNPNRDNVDDYLHMRKARNVSNVIGCELKRQLREPGAVGADSMEISCVSC